MKYGLLGEKLGHSFSKVIHEYLKEYQYDLIEISSSDFESFISNRNFCGINITIPYKEKVIPLLDEVDKSAVKIGAVNTVINQNNKLYGYNTDFGGLLKLIEMAGFEFKNKKVLILGTGGTSKTAYAVSEFLGASNIYKVSRNGEINYSNVYKLHSDVDFIINTTPCGMYPDNDSSAVDINKFISLEGVIDVVYNPLETKLVREAKNNNIKAVSGLYMLTSQAILAAELFTGKPFDKKIYEDVYKYIFSLKQNIVLTGMPGSGKSTVGKLISEKISRPFIDTDELIVKREGISIKEIFDRYGEEYFRNCETDAIRYASSLNGVVIATGGGAVLRNENVELLKSNGKIFFLDRDPKEIIPTADRPLSSDRDSLIMRYKERYPIYLKTADIEIKVNGNIKDTFDKIMECFN